MPILHGGRLLGLLFLGPWGAIPATAGPRWHDQQAPHRMKPPRDLGQPVDPPALLALAGLICRVLADAADLPKRPELDRLALIEDLLNRFFTSELRIASVAAHLGVSPSRASQIVRERYGRTFPELVESRRLELASQLLQTEELPISEVARRCGYSDHRYLARRFGRRFAMTPKQWRAAHCQRRNSEA